jgi:hypothetical protein
MDLKPKNQYQQVIWYLYNWQNFSIMNVINDAMFIKFQTRLSDIESDVSCLIASRTPKTFTNRFGRKSTYNVYSACVPKDKLIELFEKYAK